ncbi:MAG TPA: acetylglutamate kinase [bacterium]|nr:acetylglutamate kinase [bacterium]
MESLIIAKIGGSVIENEDLSAQFLRDFAALRRKKILVHGGGRSATDLAESLGIEVRMVEGRRITDREMLRVVTMVYGGLINKNVVSALQAHHCNAIGLTGADANIIPAYKREVGDIDYGFVGDFDAVNPEHLLRFLEMGLTPVLAPLTHDQRGTLLNTNADTITASVSIALATHYETHLYFCFEKSGVLERMEDEDSLIPELSREKYEQLKAGGQIASGMIPKLDNGYQALHQGVQSVVICHAGDVGRLQSDESEMFGTRITL